MKRLGFFFCGIALLTAGCVTVAPDIGPEANPAEAAQANVQLGVRYLQQGKRDLAMEKLQKALDQDPDAPEVHSALAILYEQMGDIEAAEEHLEEALDLAPDDPAVANNYGAFLCRRGRYRESLRYFTDAARNPRYGTPAAAWTNAGICAERIPDLEAAERHYRKALDVDPKFRGALLQMAELSYEQNRHLQARAFLQRFADAGPMTPQALWLGYNIERRLGDREAARTHAAQLLRDFPQSDEARALRDEL